MKTLTKIWNIPLKMSQQMVSKNTWMMEKPKNCPRQKYQKLNKNLKSNKSSWIDGILNEHLKSTIHIMCPIYVKVVQPYLVVFDCLLTSYDHQIGAKTEKNFDQILMALHFYYVSLFLNIKILIIQRTSKKFSILQKMKTNPAF